MNNDRSLPWDSTRFRCRNFEFSFMTFFLPVLSSSIFIPSESPRLRILLETESSVTDCTEEVMFVSFFWEISSSGIFVAKILIISELTRFPGRKSTQSLINWGPNLSKNKLFMYWSSFSSPILDAANISPAIASLVSSGKSWTSLERAREKQKELGFWKRFRYLIYRVTQVTMKAYLWRFKSEKFFNMSTQKYSTWEYAANLVLSSKICFTLGIVSWRRLLRRSWSISDLVCLTILSLRLWCTSIEHNRVWIWRLLQIRQIYKIVEQETKTCIV